MLLALGARGTAAEVGDETATWKIHRDQSCGLEFRYPASFELKNTSSKNDCRLWISVRRLADLHTEEMDSADRESLTQAGEKISPRSFAIRRAMLSCSADGPEGSRSCPGVVKETAFKTAKGFDAWEVYLIEVYERYGEKKRVERRTRGPIIIVDISDDEALRVLLLTPAERSLATVRAVVDTLRVWTKARRRQPQIVELRPFAPAPGTFTIRAISEQELPRVGSGPPQPTLHVFVRDPAGYRRGVDPATQTSYAETPAITSWTARDNAVMLRSAPEGRYEIQISGVMAGARYTLMIQAPDQAGTPATAEHVNRTAEPGSVDRYDVVYSRASTPPLKISSVKDISRLTVLLAGLEQTAAELVLGDPRGRRTGVDPVATAAYREVPRSSYLDEGPGKRTMVLDVRNPIDGAYELRVIGTAVGVYALDLRNWDRNGDVTSRPHFRAIPTAPGIVHRYVLDYSSLPSVLLGVRGAFVGGGQRPGDADTFLTYANPIAAETRLPAGQAAFPLLIFYGASIKPVSFNALLNGTNISARFTPEAGKSEMVSIPLRAGPNTLTLSVDGTTATAQPATDTDRLVFWVP